MMAMMTPMPVHTPELSPVPPLLSPLELPLDAEDVVTANMPAVVVGAPVRKSVEVR